MGSAIYTRGGDKGQTSLVDGSRVSKDAPRIECYGTIDETISWIGLARAETTEPFLSAALEFLQHRLYNCSSNLAAPHGTPYTLPTIAPEDVAFLERVIDRFEATTGPIERFVLPGGARAAACLHIARTVCRRAERRLVSLAAAEPVDSMVLKFINRASDFLFSAARFANAASGRPDLFWDVQFPIPKVG
ncbi:MAG: cob(I)yrinic acid a,c-diamide adenosyltransferase [Myxococcales bacterium]|nr:MAG: cob(I)yrinic acid a,c-diamide adenosyltransferase [Myxococcales bacterium]